MKLVLTFLFIFSSTLILANDGRIQGHIKDAKDEFDLKDVIVQLQNENISTLSTSSGFFDITEIKYGTYYVIFSRKGYYSLVIPDVKIENSTPVKLDIDMVEGNEKEYLFLEIGGIQVTASRELLSEEPETVHKISSGEIEHMQANSLANVLSLIPGNVQNTAPGLQGRQSISIRGAEGNAALFGTKIIIDDIPQSNNANLQTGVGVGYGSAVQSTVNTQYDAREIVAENLQSVEVQSGGSSVEYGDYTQGVITAKTKTINVPTRLKIRNNPDTREGNLIGNLSLLNTNIIYNLNYGYSERDIRVSGDEYHRISGDFKTKNDFLNSNLDFTQIFKYGRKIEEDDDDSDPEGTKAYNRDYYITYSPRFTYQLDELTKIYLRNFITYRRRNSWRRKQETPDIQIRTDRMTPGTIVGILPDTANFVYYSEVKTIGDEWTFGSKLNFERRSLIGSTLHRLLIGAEFQSDDNTGAGKSYDLLKPPGGTLKSRPRSFDNTPGIVQVGLYAEDRITGELIFPFTLNVGFRLDSYNPTGFKLGNLFKNKDVFSAEQGTFINPRLGLKLKITDNTQLRFNFGKSSKTPPISSIYPENYFLDVHDLTYKIITDPDGSQHQVNVPLVSTYTYDLKNYNLKGYQSSKYEISVDQKIGDFGISLTGYYQTTKNIPKAVEIPYEYYRYFWLDWPDTTNKIPLERVLTSDSKYDIVQNRNKKESTGFEFQITSHRIESLNTKFTVNGAFSFRKNTNQNYKLYGSTRYYTYGDTLPNGTVADGEVQLIPYYKPYGEWDQNAVINFKIDYISKPLGIWLTFRAQHELLDQDLDHLVSDIQIPEYWNIGEKAHEAAQGYYMDGKYYPIDAAISNTYGFDKSHDYIDVTTDKRPNDRWMFSIVASKSLFKGAEVSIFVDNIFNDKAFYINRKNNYTSRNHDIHWGISFSSKLDDIFN
jgi:TonB-dependent receptor-like protein/carboxypeptidase family protein